MENQEKYDNIGKKLKQPLRIKRSTTTKVRNWKQNWESREIWQHREEIENKMETQEKYDNMRNWKHNWESTRSMTIQVRNWKQIESQEKYDNIGKKLNKKLRIEKYDNISLGLAIYLL